MNLVEQRTRPRTRLIGAVGALALLVIVAAVTFGGGNDKDRSPSRKEGKKTSEAQGTGKDAKLTADDVTFVDLGAKVPTGKAGPRETKDGRALGFDRSPAGAVLAAANIFIRCDSGIGPSVFEPTISEQVIGPDKDKRLAAAQRSYQEKSTQGVGPNGELTADFEKARNDRVGVWAYRLDSYDAAATSLNLVMRQFVAGASSPTYVNFALNVRWEGGDWRLVAPLNGEFSSVAKQLLDIPSSYVVIGKD